MAMVCQITIEETKIDTKMDKTGMKNRQNRQKGHKNRHELTTRNYRQSGQKSGQNRHKTDKKTGRT